MSGYVIQQWRNQYTHLMMTKCGEQRRMKKYRVCSGGLPTYSSMGGSPMAVVFYGVDGATGEALV